MQNKTMTISEWGLLVLLSILWGGSFFFNGVLVAELQPLTLVFWRTLLAAITLHLIIRLRGQALPRGWSTWGAFGVMGLINNLLPFGLIVWGQQTIDSGLAAILNATTPLFSVLIASLVSREEQLTPLRLLGIGLGILGVGVLIGPDSLAGMGNEILAQLAILGAALSYGIAATFGRRFRGQAPLVTAAGMLSCTALMSLPLVLWLERPLDPTYSLTSWLALLGLALVSTASAYLIYFRLLASAGATNILLVTFLVPVSALILGILFLGERPGWESFVGMGLIFGGLAAVDGRLLRRGSAKKKKATR